MVTEGEGNGAYPLTQSKYTRETRTAGRSEGGRRREVGRKRERWMKDRREGGREGRREKYKAWCVMVKGMDRVGGEGGQD